jgi:hypothetical protein
VKLKKILKISAGVIIFITLPSLMLFGFFYFKYNKDLPIGVKGAQAEAMATEMLNALDYQAYENTNYIEWTFKNRHHYKWKKDEQKCTVQWKDYKVALNLNDYSLSKVYIHNFEVQSELADELIITAKNYFNNDSFWLVAPYKVFDKGTERSVVTLQNGKKALLVTYTSGGSTPGDSYLWHLDVNGKPVSFQMWTSILPIDGLEASWTDWTTTQSGALLPTFHKLFFLGLKMGEVKGTQ